MDFYKAHCFEKRGVLWMTSYSVRCDWPNTSRVWGKCYAAYHILNISSQSTASRRQQSYYSENKSYAAFMCIHIHVNGCYANLPTRWCRYVGRVWPNILLDRISLWVWDFNLCDFTDLLYAQTALNTPKIEITSYDPFKSFKVLPKSLCFYIKHLN